MELVQYRSQTQSVRQIFDLFSAGLLNLEPVFQRKGVWQKKQRIHLLDSIFQGYPIPSIFLYRRIEENTGKVVFEVIDGKQRIETLLKYAGHLRGRFAAPVQLDSQRPPPVNWRQLCKLKQQSKITEYQLQIIEVSADLSDIIELFVRINSTGNALTGQEIRNARFIVVSISRHPRNSPCGMKDICKVSESWVHGRCGG